MPRKRQNAVFTNGKVHVLKSWCETCIFRPGNLMHLEPGRIDQMVKEAVRKESCIVCHSTLNTVCPRRLPWFLRPIQDGAAPDCGAVGARRRSWSVTGVEAEGWAEHPHGSFPWGLWALRVRRGCKGLRRSILATSLKPGN